jgi:hypothetical protein
MQHSKESKVAEKIIKETNDISLNLGQIGFYLAEMSSSTQYNRLCEVFESARYRKEYTYSKEYQEEASF